MQPEAPSAERAGRRRGRISLEHLDEQQQRRMRTGFHALAGRTLYRWDEAGALQADVLVLHADSDPDAATASPAAPITLWLSDAPLLAPSSNAFRLPTGFSAHELWGVLDLIALRLIDLPQVAQAAAPPTAAAETAEAAEPAATETPHAAPTYRLLRWVTLEPPLHDLRFRRAMAAMTRRDASLRWLVEHGGLEHEDARTLLRALNRQGALQINVGAGAIPVVPVQRTSAAQGHFFNVVGRWLSGSRRQLSTGG
ncbi:hypothetical protein [Ralstonia mannitolilytica]|uniref:hypothetical protein n=1 Tax=Ralstonia mannitolilytica TaxID=105219 RepID=UPI0028F61FA4|nr:hypothetical protein [Ralstonia mannitolilytica]CAJ0736098.1 hypothetical protein R76696_01154 [Ralstonia mannitolilytica]